MDQSGADFQEVLNFPHPLPGPARGFRLSCARIFPASPYGRVRGEAAGGRDALTGPFCLQILRAN
jgi:hypothetical protein